MINEVICLISMIHLRYYSFFVSWYLASTSQWKKNGNIFVIFCTILIKKSLHTIYFRHIFANKQRRTWVLNCCLVLSLTPFSFFSTFSSFLLRSSNISVGRLSDFRQSPVCTQLRAASRGVMAVDVLGVDVILRWSKEII